MERKGRRDPSKKIEIVSLTRDERGGGRRENEKGGAEARQAH